jgi:hypothetical protein
MAKGNIPQGCPFKEATPKRSNFNDALLEGELKEILLPRYA